MAWTEGVVKLPANFHNGTPTPLDGKTVVEVPADLASITAPFKGLVVHVADNDAKTYVCLNEDVANSLDGSGDPLPAYWKELADTASIDAAIAALVGGAEGTLNTLEEIGTAIGDNPDFIGAMNTLVGTKADTVHTHAVTGITNAGATTGQVVTYDGSNVGWADAAGGGDTLTLSDTSPPNSYANKATIYSADEDSAESVPDYLYLFDESASDSVAVDAGRNGVNGLKFNSDGQDYNYNNLSTVYGLFAATKTPNVRVGGAYASFTLDGMASGERADFEMQFQFGLDSLDRSHTLVCTDPPTHDTAVGGFYSVVIDASASADTSSVVFEYHDSTAGELKTETWKIPGTLDTSTYRYTLAISFFEDDSSFSTSPVSPSVGKLRCYWGGVALEDRDNAGVKYIAASFTKLGKYGASANYPVFLGQYLNGSAAAGGPEGLYHFDGNLNDASGGTSATKAGGAAVYSASPAAGFGQEIACANPSNHYGGTDFVTLPDPGFGGSSFTFEFWMTLSGSGAYQALCSNHPSGTTVVAGQFSLLWLSDSTNYGSTFRMYYRKNSLSFGYITFQEYTPVVNIYQTRRHFALIRSPSGSDSDFHLYVDGQHISSGNYTASDFTTLPNKDWALGRGFHSSAFNLAAKDSLFDECQIRGGDTHYGSAGADFTGPTAPFAAPVNPAARFLEGKMHEFSLYNHRCIHNTSDSFPAPTGPTRSVEPSVVKVVDSEGTHSPILTANNVGMLLPKSVEGLPSGAVWNDKGVVKIAPLTGDLDTALSLTAGTAPAAATGVVKLYSKPMGSGEFLLHFNDNLTDSGPNSTTVTSANLTYADGKFGRAADFNGSTVAGSNTHVDFTGVGNDIGTGPYSIEFWLYLDLLQTSLGRGTILDNHSGQSGETAGFYNIKLYNGDIVVSHYDGSSWTQPGSPHGLSLSTWYHIAVCRDTAGHTRMFRGTSPGSTNTLLGTHTTTVGKSMGDAGHGWTMGRYMSDSVATNYHLDGRIDEFMITKTAKYTAAFTVPDRAPGIGVAKLFVMDSEGTETQLTP